MSFQLQTVPPGHSKAVRSMHSAILPEVIFNIGYVSGPGFRRMAFQAVENEGPYYALDRAWVRSFQGDEKKRLELISRGPLGMNLVHRRIVELAALPEMDDSLPMVVDKVNVLCELVTKR